jgi:Kef-type K+ transport system membrane component KefB
MSHPQFRVKLDAIGYGFLIPVFFVYSGLSFDLHACGRSLILAFRDQRKSRSD